MDCPLRAALPGTPPAECGLDRPLPVPWSAVPVPPPSPAFQQAFQHCSLVDPPLVDRTRLHAPAWVALAAALCPPLEAATIACMIAFGVRLPWRSVAPARVVRANSATATLHAVWLRAEIQAMVARGVARPCRADQLTFVLSLAVVQTAGKLRLVLDGSPVNDACYPSPSFVYEDLRFGATQFLPQDWFTSADIRSMFHHWRLALDQPWIGFAFEGQYYLHVALPLGLSLSPWVAYTLMRPVARALRWLAHRLALYADDSAIAGRSAHLAAHAFAWFSQLAARLGLLLHPDKSIAVPSQELSFLGFHISTAKWAGQSVVSLSISDAKLAAVCALAKTTQRKIKAGKPMSAAQLASTVGSIRALSPACRLVLVLSRHLQAAVALMEAAAGWKTPVLVPNSSLLLVELSTLRYILPRCRSRPCVWAEPPMVTLTVDAAPEWGYGAHLDVADGSPPLLVQAQWPCPWPERPPSASELVRSLRPEAAARQRCLDLAHALDCASATIWTPTATRPDATTWSAYAPAPPHSTTCESFGLVSALMATQASTRSQCIAVRSDCVAALAMARRRTSSTPPAAWCAVLITLFEWSNDSAVTLVAHIPGVLNVTADRLSRGWDPVSRPHLEWPLRHDVFLSLMERFPPDLVPLIDAFASFSNHRLARYWTWSRLDPWAEQVDAMAQSWRGQRLAVNPPFSLANQVVAKLLRDQPQSALVILPDWPHAPWFRPLSNAAFESITLAPADVIDWSRCPARPEPLHNPSWVLRAWFIIAPHGGSQR